MGLFVKHIDKTFADDLTFLFRFADTRQFLIEFLFGVDSDHVQSQVFVIFQHVFKFILAQQAVVDEDASQVLADSLV